MPRKLQGRAVDSNSTIIVNNISFGSNVAVNTTVIALGNSTVNTYINSTSVTTTSLVGNGASITSVDAATLGGNTASTLRSYSDTVAATAFSNAAARADSAYTNAASYADTKAGQAYSNAIAYSGNAAQAYSNATTFSSNADNISSGTLNTARLPATVNVQTVINVGANVNVNTSAVLIGNSTVNTVISAETILINGVNINTAITSNAATAYSNAIAYSGNAVQAYNNAIAYAAANSYVNNTFLPLAGGTMAGNLTVNASANIVSNLSANNVTFRGDVQIDGNLVVSGTSVTLNVASFTVEDNILHLNNGSTNTHPDLGLAGNYNDGTYKHAGIFRDATDGVWKVFDGYTPEPNTAFIDTSNASFRIANFTANVITANSFTGNGASITSVDAATVGGNTASALRSYSDTVAATAFSNAALRADAAYSNAIAYSGNAALAFSNAAARADAAYTNATSYASNATNISSGTLDTARLPATVNVSTVLNVGANVSVNTSALFVGNSTVNSVLTATSLSVGGNTATFGSAAYVVANGNVGIGTASPISKLNIIQSAAGEGFRLDGAAGGFVLVSRGGTDYSTSVRLLTVGASYVSSAPPSSGLIVEGNVGIGTTSPAAKLDVSAGIRVNSVGTVTSGFADGINMGSWDALGYDSGGTDVVLGGYRASQFSQIRFYGSGAERMRIDSSGNVGIGTTSPSMKLHVVGTAGQYVIVERSSKQLFINANWSDNNLYAQIAPRGSDNMGLSLSSKDTSPEYLFVANSGNVGIGTTTPYSLLHLAGDLTMGSGSNARPALKVTSWGYSTGYRALLIGSSSTAYTTGNTGAVTVCFNYDPSVNGNGSFTGDGREIIFRRGTRFVTPNSGDTAFNLTNLVLYDGNVGIGTDTPAVSLDLGNKTDAIKLPVGTTAQRPASPAAGMTRFNTTLGYVEAYNGAVWHAIYDPPVVSVEYLVVAGGGGGSNYNSAGGGGAGGLLTGTLANLVPGTQYTVTVGAGGSGAVGDANGTAATKGANSVFSTQTSVGGGNGGQGNYYATNRANDENPGTGGSGGGARGPGTPGVDANATGANGTAGQGNKGGNSGPYTANYPGGGGGGAGGVGGNGSDDGTTSGAGGVGLASSITGSSVFYAGGGGGSTQSGGSGGAGGNGGGGNGGNASNSYTPTAGGTNLGGGGGAGGWGGTTINGANGGSGIVILKYLSTFTATFSVGLTVSTTTSGNYKISSITAGTGTVTFS